MAGGVNPANGISPPAQLSLPSAQAILQALMAKQPWLGGAQPAQPAVDVNAPGAPQTRPVSAAGRPTFTPGPKPLPMNAAELAAAQGGVQPQVTQADNPVPTPPEDPRQAAQGDPTAPSGGGGATPVATAPQDPNQGAGGTILSALGLGGATPYIRAAGAGMAAANSPNFMTAFGQGFGGAQGAYTAADAAALKQKQEQERIDIEKQNAATTAGYRQDQAKDRDMQLRLAGNADTRAQNAADAASQDRQRALDAAASPIGVRKQAQEAIDNDPDIKQAMKLQEEAAKNSNDAEVQRQQQVINSKARQIAAEHGVGSGSGTSPDDPYLPSTRWGEKQANSEIGQLPVGRFAYFPNGVLRHRDSDGVWRPVQQQQNAAGK